MKRNIYTYVNKRTHTQRLTMRFLFMKTNFIEKIKKNSHKTSANKQQPNSIRSTKKIDTKLLLMVFIRHMTVYRYFSENMS